MRGWGVGYGLWCRAEGLGCRICGLGFGVYCRGLRATLDGVGTSRTELRVEGKPGRLPT